MRVVLTHGVFDLLHYGHIHHFQEAREFGDRLVVSVVADAFLSKSKRPMINDEAERLAHVAAIRHVDDAILCQAPGPEKIIESLRPDVYVRGRDYIGRTMPESALLAELGIEIRYTPSSFPRTTDRIEQIVSAWRAFNK